jgi:Complex 1 protein (LYR family)
MVDRSALLALYRRFVRVAQGMPTGHRRQFVLLKARQEFRRYIGVVDPTEQETLYQYGATMLEQADEQRKHLTECKRENLLDCELTPQEKAEKEMGQAQHTR